LKDKIKSPNDIGNAVRKKRKEDGLTLADASALCGVGYRFLSDLENGKPTVELGKTLQVIAGLGLEVRIGPKEWPDEQRKE
jgi:HTH-type transcriptional regulator / antitoxin HipB